MLNRILSRLKGNNKLENATLEQRDNETFVVNCVVKNGVDELMNASSRLKSDAKFILDLVRVCPECLNECADVLFDRYVQNGYWQKIVCCNVLQKECWSL